MSMERLAAERSVTNGFVKTLSAPSRNRTNDAWKKAQKIEVLVIISMGHLAFA